VQCITNLGISVRARIGQVRRGFAEVLNYQLGGRLNRLWRSLIKSPMDQLCYSGYLGPDRNRTPDLSINPLTKQRCNLQNSEVFHGGSIGIDANLVQIISGQPLSPPQLFARRTCRSARPKLAKALKSNPFTLISSVFLGSPSQ
jgi:hypothetical protein